MTVIGGAIAASPSASAASGESPLRVALVGVGDAAGHHARALAAFAHEAPHLVEVAGLVARDAERGRSFVGKSNLSGDVPLFSSIEELLAARVSDAVILATPDALHFEHARQCLQANQAVLVEKPLVPSLAEADSLRRLAAARDRALWTGYHLRHHPAHEQMARLVRAGGGAREDNDEGDDALSLGPIRSLFLRWAWPDPSVSGWRATGELARHFSLSALGTHAIDAALQLTGDTDEVKDVVYLLAPQVGIDHAAEVSLRFASGLLAHVSVAVTHRASSRIAIVADGGELDAEGTMGAHGGGMLTFRPRGRDAVARPLHFQPESPYLRQLRAFVRAAAQGFTDARPLRENVRVLEQICP